MAAAEAGADGVLLIDAVVEEKRARIFGRDGTGESCSIFLAAPTGPDERLKAIAAHASFCLRHLAYRHYRQATECLAADAAALVNASTLNNCQASLDDSTSPNHGSLSAK